MKTTEPRPLPVHPGVNYIIFGGNGFIGKALNAYLAGENVITIGRSSYPVQPQAANRRYYSVLGDSLDDIASFLKGSENIIIDLSFTSVSNAGSVDPEKDFSDNIKLVMDNLHFAKKVRTRKYVYLSSGGTVYGRSGEEQINELHATNPISTYGIIKLASEKYVQMFCSMNDMDFNILRPSNVYGPGQVPFRGQGIIATALGCALENSPITIYGAGDNVRDYIYIDDLCAWLVAICEKGVSGEIYNIGSGEGHSILEITDLIRDILAVRQWDLLLRYLPDRPFDVKRNVLDNSKIRAATGLYPSTVLAAGIAKAYAWISGFMAAARAETGLIK